MDTTPNNTDTATSNISSETTKEDSSEDKKNTTSGNELRPEFKAAMDSYEAFYDEYCSFMKSYYEDPTNSAYLSQYADLITRSAEMEEAFDEWDESDMNTAELEYYLEVTNRVLEKLSDLY